MEVVVTVNSKYDFSEVKKDISCEDAVSLSNHCLNCRNPMCKKGCPLEIDIPDFISAIKNEEYERAYEIISQKSVMPEVCGRVCPQELTCEAKCVRGLKGESVKIGNLERFVSNYKTPIKVKKSNGLKVAVVGSGPFGLSSAYHLKKEGFDVTVFESSHVLGGVLIYGIPEFRLPKKIVDDVIYKLENMGVIFKTDVLIGATITIEELKKNFDYIFLGTGAGVPKMFDIPGVMSKNVLSANELLTRINVMHAPNSDTPLIIPRKVVVIGGGNVACDAARSLVRLGSDVTICYRKSEEFLKMRKEEYEHAKMEHVNFIFNAEPVRIETDKAFTVNKCVFKIAKKYKKIECDMVIIAIGTTHNDLIPRLSGIKSDEFYKIEANDYVTSDNRVFAGGDATRGNATVIDALSDGLKAVEKLMQIIKK